MITYFGGWFWSGSDDWYHMSAYLKYNETLGPGLNVIPLQSDQITDITISVQIFAGSGPGAEYHYALLSHNPVNESLPIGTPLYYIDQLLIKNSFITGNITMTITFPCNYFNIMPLIF